MHLLSTCYRTHLHSLPDLNTRSTYEHSGSNKRQDFHLAANANVLAAVSRQSDHCELLICRLPKKGTTTADSDDNNSNNDATVRRLQKVVLSDLNCATCSWARCPEVALGLTNGTVRFYDIKTRQYSAVKLSHDNSRQSVVSLAYSNCNELLGSVCADGEISIFGLKTAVRMDRFRLDSATMLRFHPQRRYNAAVATEPGSVIVLDVSAKRTLWADRKAHSSPCPEVCWSPTDENMLLSAGYDCVLNVFDMRQRQVAIQIKHDAPFSCCAVSGAAAAGAGSGQIVAAGTLKGDLCAYDLRTPHEQLAFRKSVHETQVSRVAFVDGAAASVATATSASSSSSSSAVTTHNATAAAAEAAATAAAAAVHVPNILGGGRRRSLSGRTSLMSNSIRTRPSPAQVDLRPSLGGRPDAGALFADLADDDADNSFNTFLDKNTKVRDSLVLANRRDSLLEMEVRPVRFADISDSDCSLRGGASLVETPPDAKIPTTNRPMAPQRRSRSIHQVIPEDDVSAEAVDRENGASDAYDTTLHRVKHVTLRNDPYRKILRDKGAAANVLVMSSTINDSTGIRAASGDAGSSSSMSLFVDKENHATASPIVGHKQIAANGAAAAAAAVVGDPTIRQHLDELLDERFAAMAKRVEDRQTQLIQHVDDVALRVEQMHFDVQSQLWCLEDTDLLRLRTDVETTLRGVERLTLSNAFVQEFIELKEENERLQRQVAALKGDPAPGPRL